MGYGIVGLEKLCASQRVNRLFSSPLSKGPKSFGAKVPVLQLVIQSGADLGITPLFGFHEMFQPIKHTVPRLCIGIVSCRFVLLRRDTLFMVGVIPVQNWLIGFLYTLPALVAGAVYRFDNICLFWHVHPPNQLNFFHFFSSTSFSNSPGAYDLPSYSNRTASFSKNSTVSTSPVFSSVTAPSFANAFTSPYFLAKLDTSSYRN